MTDKIRNLAESQSTKMIVLSDGDILKNQVSSGWIAFPLGYDHYSSIIMAIKPIVEHGRLFDRRFRF